MPDSTAPQRTSESLTSSFHTVCQKHACRSAIAFFAAASVAPADTYCWAMAVSASRYSEFVWMSIPKNRWWAHQAIWLSPFDSAIWSFYSALVLAHLAAVRYEEGLFWARERLRENGDLPALRFKLSLCGHLGRLEEAGECLQRINETMPEPTVTSIMQGVSKGMASEVFGRFAEGLRKAGLPET